MFQKYRKTGSESTWVKGAVIWFNIAILNEIVLFNKGFISES